MHEIKNIILSTLTLTHMKYFILVILALLFTGAVISGCIQSSAPEQNTVHTPMVTDTEKKPVPQPSFSMSNIYLKNTYAFQSEQQIYVEEIRVDNASWGIRFDVVPLTDDVIYSWFEMNITNIGTGWTDTLGYGRTNGFERNHLVPMYNTGLYKIEMRGNRVKVDVMFAKRNP